MGVDPFDPAALAVAHGFGGREFAFFATARVVVDEGDMSQALGDRADFPGVVRGVGQVVEIDDPSGAHLRQRNGDLTVVQAGRGQDRTDGNIAVDHVQMQLVAAPAFLPALAVLLAALVAKHGEEFRLDTVPQMAQRGFVARVLHVQKLKNSFLRVHARYFG